MILRHAYEARKDVKGCLPFFGTARTLSPLVSTAGEEQRAKGSLHMGGLLPDKLMIPAWQCSFQLNQSIGCRSS